MNLQVIVLTDLLEYVVAYLFRGLCGFNQISYIHPLSDLTSSFLFKVITGPYTKTAIAGPTKISGNKVVIAVGFQE